MNLMTVSSEEYLRPILLNAFLCPSQCRQLGTFNVHLDVVRRQDLALFQKEVKGRGGNANVSITRQVTHEPCRLESERTGAFLICNGSRNYFSIGYLIEPEMLS